MVGRLEVDQVGVGSSYHQQQQEKVVGSPEIDQVGVAGSYRQQQIDRPAGYHGGCR